MTQSHLQVFTSILLFSLFFAEAISPTPDLNKIYLIVTSNYSEMWRVELKRSQGQVSLKPESIFNPPKYNSVGLYLLLYDLKFKTLIRKCI